MTDLSRRSVLTGACAFGAVALAACSGNTSAGTPTSASTPTGTSPSTSPATSPGSTGAAAGEFSAGALADVPVGGGLAVTAGGHDLIVTQPVAGRPIVFPNRCTHQGARMATEGAQIACPLHGSRFDLNGQVVNGPATQPLQPVALRVEDGQIIVEGL